MKDKDPRPTSASSTDLARRRLLTGIAGAAGALALPGCEGGAAPAQMSVPAGALPDPANSGIDHIIVVMMENRSFDHFLGWVPGADGLLGQRYPDKQGDMIETFHLASHPEYGYQGCGKEDPNHNYDGGRLHYNGGRMDGWLATVGDENVAGDHFPVGYYLADDLPFFKGVAQHFTVCDRFFHGILASTFPNRVYLHAGQSDRVSNTTESSSLPTIWDRMSDAGLSARYYFHDLPVTALWAERYLDRSTRYEQFALDAAAGLLPSLSIIDPRFLGEAPNGVSNDDHPQADVRNGQAFLDGVYNTLRASPQWERSLLVICYDEWGGFYDHVAPPLAPVGEEEFAATGNDGRLGFRVPCVIIGPRARRGHVSHFQFDVNSILNLITWRFGLPPLGVRGLSSLNLALALDFSNAPNLDAPDFGVPAGPFGVECSTGAPIPLPNSAPLAASAGAAAIYAKHNDEWRELAEKARRCGFQ